MGFNRLVRQVHRWTCIAFVIGVVTYMVAMSAGEPPYWLGLFALVPLILLLVTGLYMFVLPYLGSGKERAAG